MSEGMPSIPSDDSLMLTIPADNDNVDEVKQETEKGMAQGYGEIACIEQGEEPEGDEDVYVAAGKKLGREAGRAGGRAVAAYFGLPPEMGEKVGAVLGEKAGEQAGEQFSGMLDGGSDDDSQEDDESEESSMREGFKTVGREGGRAAGQAVAASCGLPPEIGGQIGAKVGEELGGKAFDQLGQIMPQTNMFGDIESLKVLFPSQKEMFGFLSSSSGQELCPDQGPTPQLKPKS